MKSQTWLRKVTNIFMALIFALSGLTTLIPAEPVAAAGVLSVSLYSAAGAPLNAYNLVVDSNVESPSTYAPSVATVAVRFCNTAPAGAGNDLTNVVGYIGDFNGTSSKPGLYPRRYVTDTLPANFTTLHPVLNNQGSYAFTHVGGAQGTADASRYIGTLTPGECSVQYWHFTYPQCENNPDGTADTPPCNVGNSPTWGDSVKPQDDLWLNFDVWATADGNPLGAGSPNATWKMTMRNEISAMANKIEPNPNGAWFNTNTNVVRPGDVITSNGVMYSFGNINQGFDNDGDFVPDYNAWAQPLGAPDFDPTCFRLIRTSTVLTVSRSSGLPPLILNYTDQLYYTNLPANNTGAIGEVRYTFLALSGPCSLPMSPYQEVASGRDNEKFNGDYGTGIPPVVSSAPEVAVDKGSSPATVGAGAEIAYTIAFTNNGSTSAGLTLVSGWDVNMPLVISDTIPIGLQYVGGSASATLNYTPSSSPGYTVRFSTDKGATWTSTLADGTPSTAANPVWIQWWLSDPLPAKPNSGPNTSSGTATFRARVPASGYTGSPVIENKGCAQFDGGAPFACDTATNLLTGNNSIGDFVWRDENNDGGQTGETANGINGVKVTLYYDANNNGVLDNGDLEYATQNSYTNSSAGYYSFTNLPDGRFIVKVDAYDSDLPTGYRPTTSTFYAVALDPTGATTTPVNHATADFGFGPSLTIAKRLLGDVYEGREILYSISLSNKRPGTGTTVGNTCVYEFWASTGSTANAPKNFTDYYKAFGEPDGGYAYGNFAIGANRWIKGTGYDPGRASGTFSKIEAVFPLYISASLSDDSIQTLLYQGATQVGTTNAFDSAYLNSNHLGLANAKYAVWDITASSFAPGGSWDWGDFSLLTLHLQPNKSGGADPSVIYLDAMGFRVTVNGTCPTIDTNDIMTTVPLTDTYNTTYLEFVSAEPPHTTYNASTGVITWTNVGPIYPGETKTVFVRFLGKNIGTSAVTINNSTCSTGTSFSDGGAANNACATATGVMLPTGSINGYVYSDPNSSGWNYSPGGGDLPIANVPVTIYGCYSTSTGELITSPGNNNTCTQAGGEWRARTTVLTNASGYYEFTGLLNGFYYIQVTSSVLPGTVTQTAEANDDQSVTGTLPNTTAQGQTCGTCNSTWGNSAGNLVQNNMIFNPIDSPGETISGVNFGYRINPGVYGSIWEDNDGDGVKESTQGEGPISSVTVWLYANSDCSGTPVSTTSTDSAGRYQFGNLNAGTTYCIAVDTSTLPGGSSVWSQTGENDGSVNNRITFTATAGVLSGSHDFGFRKVGSYTIGDTLYYDWNGDGTQQSHEEGIPNITVSLYEDTNGNGIVDAEDALIATTVTNASGFYQFTTLPSGNYLVIVDTADPDFPKSVVQTQDPNETGLCVTCDNRGKVTITTVSIDTIDFGYWPNGSGSIGDTVYRDMNGDSVQAGPLETGIANITVWLEVDLNNDGAYTRVMTTTTDSSGQYLFSDLPDARYRVVVDSSDPDLPKDGFNSPYIPSTPTTTAQIIISNGSSYMDADFGFKPLGAIGDTIYWDANANGDMDWNETGIGGVVITLTNTSIITLSNGTVYPVGAYTLVTTTDSSGQYLFTGLVAGTYRVEVGTITGNPVLTGDPDTNGIPCAPDPGAPWSAYCDSRTTVTVKTGTVFLGADFGYRPKGVIGDFVWLDSDGDGVQDDKELGIPGVVITVTPPVDVDLGRGLGQPITTTTDFDGYYSFANLPDATYTVAFATPAGMTATSGSQSVGGSATVVITNGVVTRINGTDCSNCDLNIDSGYRYSGAYSVSGTVFFDAGNTTDGTNDKYGQTGDVAYANITVYLWKDGAIVGETKTDASGVYTFTNLPAAGGYTVSVDRNGVLGLMALTATPNNTPEVKNFNTFTIETGPITQQDFGFYALLDMGDLPTSYEFVVGTPTITQYTTLFAHEGAMHINTSGTVSPTIYLGTVWDNEKDGQPDTDAGMGSSGGDEGDEDGINLSQPWYQGETTQIAITVYDNDPTYKPYVAGWFDWNQDGKFGETELVKFGNLAHGSHLINLPIPATSKLGRIYMRFRIYQTQSPPEVLSPIGAVINGEVEDYWKFNENPTAITLAAFKATPRDNGILVTWETAMELDNVGFNLYRSTTAAGPYTQINDTLIPPQFPGEVMGGYYEWLDTNVQPGVTYYYKLEDIDLKGVSTFHGPVSTAVVTAPTAVQMQQVAAHAPLAPAVLGLFMLVGVAFTRRRRRER